MIDDNTEGFSADFIAAWREMEAKGYQYGRDALEGVYCGWKLRGEATSRLIRETVASAARDTEHTDAPVCPHCGKAHDFSTLYDRHRPWTSANEIEAICDACSQSFAIARRITITYSTRKP